MKPQVSIIIPIHNGELWINKCFESILNQTAINALKVEVCVCNDASTDATTVLLKEWTEKFSKQDIILHVFENTSSIPGGVGYAKNKAITISSGEYLCFQDVDDVMLPSRILLQYERAKHEGNCTIVGSRFKRIPEDSTARYTKWANSLTLEQLDNQIYTSHGPTIIMPTWFCHRSVFERVNGFCEDGKGTPEDLIFFYKHLDLGGKVCRVDEVLLVYNYHPNAATFSIHENAIWDIRLERLERDVLLKWTSFTIWNAGKQGRKLFNSLSSENQAKVIAMCDVDVNKINKHYTPYNSETRKAGRSIPMIHFKDASKPFIICVKMDLTRGEFEKNLESLNLQENQDYVLFS